MTLKNNFFIRYLLRLFFSLAFLNLLLIAAVLAEPLLSGAPAQQVQAKSAVQQKKIKPPFCQYRS